MSILNTIKKPYKIFADVNTIEFGALQQFVDTMNQPSVTYGALMPDVHQGYTVPIGCVFNSDGVIFPSAVGFDIGCGCCAISTTFDAQEVRENAQKIYDAILSRIPVGFNHHGARHPLYKEDLTNISSSMHQIYLEKQGWLQCSSLGSGNHFCEIGVDDKDTVWIIIHSGSRGVGHGCAEHYMKLASPNGKASEGFFGFDVNSKNGMNYIKDMNWCLEFALQNRNLMMHDILDVIESFGIVGMIDNTFINRNHNHAETKDGKNWIHRKGATHAEYDMLGVVPGNMRDGSFIVRGLGNPDSLCSSSHGAGRVMGRGQAKKVLDEEVFKTTMGGIIANVSRSSLDESPMAYKDIFDVMDAQSDLVEIVAHVKPILNIKG
jgi:tRNA-splicing ligase RtcB (3'-phosphate/5'-hydroxy nucleic acid ligase)